MLSKLSILIVFCFVFASFSLKNNNQEKDKILWSKSHKLIWEDFQGEIDTSRVNVAALTCSKIEIISSQFRNEVPVYELGCFFIKKKSWKIVADNYTLGHEQLHFDIGEIYARKIRSAFDSLNRKKVENTDVYDKVFNSYIDECEKYNDLYDNEVYFNEKKQMYWKEKVASNLAKLKKWEYPVK